jgi:hypothetical protein
VSTCFEHGNNEKHPKNWYNEKTNAMEIVVCFLFSRWSLDMCFGMRNDTWGANKAVIDQWRVGHVNRYNCSTKHALNSHKK